LDGVFHVRRYLLVSPCRDEAELIQNTIDAVAKQTVLPAKWLIVDDGSRDDTPQILAAAAQKYPFIQVVRKEDRGKRLVGSGVIEAFYHGLMQVRLDDYDYLCKLDADLEIGPRYFERCMERCEQDPWLGNISGKLQLKLGDKLVAERIGDENAVGAAKFYRVACFQEIGGFVRGVCWDGIDGHMCRMRGWVASSVDDPELRITHLRHMGSSDRGIWVGRLRWGRGKYFMGSALYYVVAVALYRTIERPFLIGGLGILWGYLAAALRRDPRMADQNYLRYLRRFERYSLFFGKSRTTARENDRIRSQKPPKAIAAVAPPARD
jgi:glycosyltransferase involved in cell wall biosynthesis